MRGLIAIVIAASIVGPRASAAEPEAVELMVLIDKHIDTRLKAERIPASDPADDAEFLRRLYLDLHGVVPTSEQVEQFLAGSGPDQRARLIDQLLASARFGEYLGDIWQGYLMSPLADDQIARSDRFRRWLAEQFNTRTWDRIATDLLTATGKMEENPAVIYLVESRLPRTVPDLTDLTSHYLLGIRLNCAQCHDHPFTTWTRKDYWGLAAFFTQIQTPGKSKQIYQFGVKDNRQLTLAALTEGGAPDGFLFRPPTFLGGEELQTSDTTNRGALAAWMTSPENPYFARAMVNRTWWRLFGRGIVHPVDDMHEGNPPSHPELLDLLAQRFVESGFDLKDLTRVIVSTRAYQRTSRPGDATERQARLFGRMSVKVLSAGQLYDSLVTIFGSPSKAAGVDPRQGVRAEFMQFFAEDGDPDPTAYKRGIPHLLRQMNSGQFAGRNISVLAADLAKPDRSADEVIRDLFLAILSRRPTESEVQFCRSHLADAGSDAAGYRELAWALMMSSEFSLNH